MPSGRIRVLLTEGSSLSARHTLSALGDRYHIEVADSGRWRLGRFSRFVRRWHRVPPYQTQPREYVAHLLELVRGGRFDVLVPTHEETYLVARFQETFSPHVAIAVPSFASMERLLHKARFSQLLNELGLPQPHTRIIRSADEAKTLETFPCFIKRPVSTASQGVRKITGRSELVRVIAECEADGWFDGDTEILVQEAASGIESAAIALFHHGVLVGFHCFEEWAKGSMGMPIARRSAEHPLVRDHARLIGKHLQWHGPLCLAYFHDAATGTPQYIECNPRIGETMHAVLSGVNLCRAWIEMALGNPVELEAPKPDVRTYCGFLVLLAQAIDGAGRGRLIGQVFDRIRRRGFFEDAENELIRPREDWMSLLPAIAINLLLLAYPRGGRWLVSGTVSRYALTAEAAEKIRDAR